MPEPLIKNRLWHMCFPMNFAKFLRISFLTEHFLWMPLELERLPVIMIPYIIYGSSEAIKSFSMHTFFSAINVFSALIKSSTLNKSSCDFEL